MPSIFSGIVSGEIPSIKVYEDAQTLAFMDISPATRGHVLVVPKDEHADLLTLPPELLAAVSRTVQRVAQAIATALQPDGINIVQNNGVAAGQTVFHYHVHIVPRWDGDGALPLWVPQQSDPAALQATATLIRGALA